MQKGQTLIFVLVGILVIAGIAGGAYYLGRQTTPKPSPSPVVSQSPQSSPTPDETANWKTYTNESGGYSVTYPPNYTVEVTGPTNNIPITDVNFIPNNFTQKRSQGENIGNIYIGKEKDIKPAETMEEYLKNTIFSGGYYGSIFKSITQDKIGNVAIYRVSTTLTPYVKSSQTYIRSGNHVYGFTFQTGGGEGPINPPVYQWVNYADYEKIIESFRPI